MFKGYISVMLALAIPSLVVSDELPQGPLLQRFGDAINQLPIPASPPEATDATHKLDISGQEVFIKISDSKRRKLEMTDNPSIDNMQIRDRDACRRVQAAVSGQGRQLSLGCE
ncbi:hypothetical protein K2E96_16260 [Pseudomonas sp. ERGC3:05]|nr:hypothetical protein [Pseudomonas sp. ERGC3:01]QZC92684.1 hypothetical protein K2E96_16260 [Pseudomonas sp. ERGC3:05]